MKAEQKFDKHTTEAMKIAAKQGWRLPDGTIKSLTAELKAVEAKHAQSKDTIRKHILAEQPMNEVELQSEVNRRHRAQQVNLWRARTKLQAAIDTLRAENARKKKAA